MSQFRRIALLLLLAAILGIGGFFVFRGFSFSVEDVSISVEAPGEIDTGVAFPLRVVVANSSRTTLQDLQVVLSLPERVLLLEGAEGKRVGSDMVIPLDDLVTLQKKTLSFQFAGDADPGTTILFRAKVSFRPSVLAARFTVDASHRIAIAEVPLAVDFTFSETIQAGEDFSFTIHVQSDASRTLENLRVFLSAPEDFVFRESLPNPCPEREDCWDIDQLLPGQDQEIIVRGSFSDGDFDAEFGAEVGAFDVTRNQLRTYAEVTTTVRVEAPLFMLAQWVGDTKEPRGWAFEPGQRVQMRLTFENRSSSVLENIALRLSLEGKAVNQNTFEASEDFVRINPGEYRWDPADVFALRFVRPGTTGEITFSFELADPTPFRNLSDANPQIVSRLTAQSSQGLLGESTLQFQVSTKLTLHQEILFSNAPGGRNSGPIPPRVGETTTYTVVWQVLGGVNGVRNVVVRGILGPNVKYLAVIDPIGAPLSYDASSQEVIWPVGDMLAGTGFFTPPKEVVFRIGLTPGEGDSGTIPEIMNLAKITGEDAFTGVMREQVLNESIRADLPDDSTIDDEGTVLPAS